MSRSLNQTPTLLTSPYMGSSTPSDVDAMRATALQPFWTALANRASGPVDVVAMGHSFVEGVYSTSVNTTFTALFRDALRARFQPSGITGGFGFKTQEIVSHFTDDFLTVSGGTTNNQYGLGCKSRVFSATGQTYTYTGVTITGFDIFFVGYSGGGTGYYKVDGGTATTFSTNNATIADGMRVQVRGLTAGSHTIEIGWSSGGTVFITGAMLYNGDESKGIRMWQNAQSSTQTSLWTNPGAPHWSDNMGTIQPSLVVITDMCNDYGGNGTPTLPSATTKANLQTIISKIRSACTTSPAFVICTEWQRLATNPVPNEPWANYINVAKSIAASDPGVLVWDMGARFGSGPFSAGNTLINADKIHPTAAGMQLWADALAAFVSPR